MSKGFALKKFVVASISVLAIALILAARTNAQSTATGPQFLISWKSLDSAAPVAYAGKALPGINSLMVASVAVISDGKIVDLSPYTIYWYLDDNFIGGDVGKQNITFNAPGRIEIASLRVEIPDYPSGLLVNTAHIQIVKPQVVIVVPYAGGVFSQTPIMVQAVPFFLRASDLAKLSFQWTVNGQAVATQENPENLIINLGSNTPSGYSVAINLTVRQSDNPLFNADANVTLTKSNL